MKSLLYSATKMWPRFIEHFVRGKERRPRYGEQKILRVLIRLCRHPWRELQSFRRQSKPRPQSSSRSVLQSMMTIGGFRFFPKESFATTVCETVAVCPCQKAKLISRCGAHTNSPVPSGLLPNGPSLGTNRRSIRAIPGIATCETIPRQKDQALS